MKLQPDQFNAPFVSAYQAGWIAVNGERHHGPLVIHTESGCSPWAVSSFEELNAQSFAPFALLKPELIVFGSGNRLRFPPPAWLTALTQARVASHFAHEFAAGASPRVERFEVPGTNALNFLLQGALGGGGGAVPGMKR